MIPVRIPTPCSVSLTSDYSVAAVPRVRWRRFYNTPRLDARQTPAPVPATRNSAGNSALTLGALGWELSEVI